MRIEHTPEGKWRAHLDSSQDAHLLVAHTTYIPGYCTYRLTDDVEDWLILWSPRSIHCGKMIGYWIDFDDQDVAFHFRIRWS